MSTNDVYETALEQLEESLHEYKHSSVVTKVEILTAGNGCDACNKLESKTFTIEDALKNKILPCKECTYKRKKQDEYATCRCCYAPVVE